MRNFKVVAGLILAAILIGTFQNCSNSSPDEPSKQVSYSYDIAKSAFYTSDVLVRITNNPHCPECTLDKKGEVYQAIRYWLDHR